MSKSVTGTIKLRVRGEPVEVTLTIPDSPVRPVKLLPALQEMTNVLTAHAVRQAEAEGKEVGCKPGCWACCRHLIPVTEVEARFLADLVARTPEPRRSELRARFRKAIVEVEDASLAEPLRDPSQRGGRSLHDLGMAYFEHSIPCPFLQDFRCSIHSNRPLACREHLVTSPPENCDRPTAESIEKLPMPASVFGALIRISQKPDTKAAPFVPLVFALEWAAANPDKSLPVPGPAILRQVVENLTGKLIDV